MCLNEINKTKVKINKQYLDLTQVAFIGIFDPYNTSTQQLGRTLFKFKNVNENFYIDMTLIEYESIVKLWQII